MYQEEPGAEESLGFGQIVPLFLLILLLVQLANSISGTYSCPELDKIRCD